MTAVIVSINAQRHLASVLLSVSSGEGEFKFGNDGDIIPRVGVGWH